MATNAPISPNQTQPVQHAKRTSWSRKLRILGGRHVGLGVVCCFLGIVGVILSNTEMESHCKSYDHNNNKGYVYGYWNHHCGIADTIFLMDLTNVVFSGWFILIGCLPLCMTEQRQSSWRCLTLAFLVCNILSAVVFSSSVFGLAIVGAVIADFDTGSIISVSALLAVCSFIEFILSIVAAKHSCSHSQFNTGNHQSAIYINNAQSGFMHTLPSTQTSTVNQQGYHQIWIPEIQRYNGQQLVNMQNSHQPAGHSQGIQMTIQGYHGKQPQAFAKG
ncbi:uncharacterized protein LOC143078249 [Mytilus galloprovincialis]|uniref:uncharacterized protein LOC143078249 n=1 Tax=Mytilus galloprovincialis TaxID=29158 RepID=UPI003F7BB1BD